MPEFDDAIIGAGILGLAHAFHLARRGRRVIVFERGSRALGASVRNFGMLWPIGQPAGELHRMALRSLQHWQTVLRESGIWHERTGSLHLAYHKDEAQVLREFVERYGETFGCAFLPPNEMHQHAQRVRAEGLKGALWSATETCVDPRQVIAELPDYLARRFGVEFVFGCTITEYDRPTVQAGKRNWRARNLYVCAGDDFQTLYPEVFAESGLMRCKLQMLRTAPATDGFRLGAMLAAGLTLRHYKSFQDCPTLPAVKARFATENPEFDRFGIHVMASQNGNGELVLGDSHEYDDAIEPFDREEIDALVLGYLETFLTTPIQIASRWHGIYAKHPTTPYFVAPAEPGVTVITGVGGAGMTLSFGLAETVVCENLGEAVIANAPIP